MVFLGLFLLNANLSHFHMDQNNNPYPSIRGWYKLPSFSEERIRLESFQSASNLEYLSLSERAVGQLSDVLFAITLIYGLHRFGVNAAQAKKTPETVTRSERR